MLEKLWSAFIEYGFQSKYFLIIFIVCIIPVIAKWLGAEELVSAIKDLIFGFAKLLLLVAGIFLFSGVVYGRAVDIMDSSGTLLIFCIFLLLIFKLFIYIIKKESLFLLVVCEFVIRSLGDKSIYKTTVYISPVLIYLIYKYIIKPVLIFVSNCYKIRTLKSMERIIKKYIKRNGYQSMWRFDNFICARYWRGHSF